MKEKIESYMGFARKAGALVAGTDACIMSMKKKKVKLLVIAADAAENSIEKLKKTATGNGVNFRVFSSKEKLCVYSGMKDKIVFGITDSNFAKIILKEIDFDVR